MKKLKTEEQIIIGWKEDFNKPVVSICCTTYNFESYIEKTLESFLIQETDFPFEILIYDDASTDKTAKIISEYEAKYPKLIKPIYQTENKLSKGMKPSTFNFSRANGAYVAICDGDDFWFSADKLQVQIELMKRYPDINISFHSSYLSDVHNNIIKNRLINNNGNEIKIISPEEVILGGGEFMPTSSLMIKTKILNSLPEWFYKDAPVGDVYIQMISSIPNGALYLPKLRGVYRVNVLGSWTSRKNDYRSCESINKEAVNREKCHLALNVSSKEIYKRSFYDAIARDLLSCSFRALNNNCYKLFKTLINKSSAYKSDLNITQKIFMLFCNYPKLLKILLKIPLIIKKIIN